MVCVKSGWSMYWDLGSLVNFFQKDGIMGELMSLVMKKYGKFYGLFVRYN